MNGTRKHLAEGMAARCNVLKNRGGVPQVVVSVSEIHWAAYEGHLQVIVQPAAMKVKQCGLQTQRFCTYFSSMFGEFKANY